MKPHPSGICQASTLSTAGTSSSERTSPWSISTNHQRNDADSESIIGEYMQTPDKHNNQNELNTCVPSLSFGLRNHPGEFPPRATILVSFLPLFGWVGVDLLIQTTFIHTCIIIRLLCVPTPDLNMCPFTLFWIAQPSW